MAVEMTKQGKADTGRYSDFMHYPLPPIPDRADVKRDGWGRYKLPSPSTGRLTAFSRATTLAETTEDHYNLNQWQIRTKVAAVLKAQQAHARRDNENISDEDYRYGQLFVDLVKALDEGTGRAANKVIDEIDNLLGGRDAAELGGAVHDWLGALDMGQVLVHQIPEKFQPYALAYQAALARAGFVAVPIYVERIVINDRGEETVAGTLDRIYMCIETGELYLGDLKTSKTLEWSYLSYSIQFAVYGYATLMLKTDGTGWEPMPEINQDMCVVVHVPSDQPERSQVVAYDLYAGGEHMITAIEVRAQRRNAAKRVMGPTTPIPSKNTLRYVEARQALQNIHDVEEAQSIVEQYEDVWDDALNEFGAACLELATTATTNKE